MLGQEQDSKGGGFQTSQSFKGMLSNVNIWDRMLTSEQIKKMSTSCLLDEENKRKAYKWLDFLREGEGRLIIPSSCNPFRTGRQHLNSCHLFHVYRY